MEPEPLFPINSRKSLGADSQWSSSGPCLPLSQSLGQGMRSWGWGGAGLAQGLSPRAEGRERGRHQRDENQGHLLAGCGDSGAEGLERETVGS